MQIGSSADQTFTYRSAFTNNPPLLVCAGTDDSNTDDGHWKDYAYGIAFVKSRLSTGGSIRVCLGADSGYRWPPNLWWIAFGL